jgi:hypothetical protein
MGFDRNPWEEWVVRDPFGQHYRVSRSETEVSREEREESEYLIRDLVWSIVRSPFDHPEDEETLLTIYERFRMHRIERPAHGPRFRRELAAMARKIEDELRVWARMGRLRVEELPPPQLILRPPVKEEEEDAAPLTVREAELEWIEIALLDADDGRPVPNVPYIVIDSAGNGIRYEGVLDDRGWARVDGVRAGTCRVSFPHLDAREVSR